MAGWADKLLNSANHPEDVVRDCASAALLCTLAIERGADLEQCLAGTGIDERALRDPSGQITEAQEIALIANIQAALGNPAHLGLEMGARYKLTTHGLWGYAVLSSRTAREAIEIGLRFIDLTYVLTGISGREDADEFMFVFEDRQTDEGLRRFGIERDMTGTLAVCEETINARIPLTRVALRLPRPADPAPYEEAFGVRPVFDAPESLMAFDVGLLDLPLPQASPLTTEACVQQCLDALDRRGALPTLSARVRHELVRDPRAMPGQDEIASALHVSVRTLRRKLAEEETTFRELVDQTRAGLAEELLGLSGLTIEQIADRLGYSEASSFVHAFTRWKGVSPRRWQRARDAVPTG